MSTGLPKWKAEIWRARQIWGYVPDDGEEFLFAIIVATLAPGPYSFTRAGIDPGETVELINAFTGLEGITPPAGWDYIIKEVWINFDQPMFLQLYQEQVGDTGCDVYVPAFSSPFMIGLPIGWTRAQVESINVESTTKVRVKNLGAQLAYGKCWIVGFMKEALYAWY